MVIVFTLGFSGLYGRFNILDSEFKKRSMALAEGCVDVMIIRLQANPNYTLAPSADVVFIGSDICKIWSIVPAAGWPKTIKIQAVYPSSSAKKSYTNLEIGVSRPADRVVVDSWKEIPNLP